MANFNSDLSIISIIFLVVLLCCGCHGNTLWEDQVGKVSVKFDRGSIMVDNGINSIRVAFDRIYELGNDAAVRVGQSSTLKHRFHLFEEQFYSFAPDEFIEVAGRNLLKGTFRNITAFRKSITTTLAGQAASFEINILVYLNDTIVVNNESGERYEVRNGTVKVSFTLGDWKFCGDENVCLKNGVREEGQFVEVYFNVTGSSIKKPATLGSPSRGTNFVEYRNHPVMYDYGVGDVTFSRKYEQNHTYLKIAESYPKKIELDGGEYIVTRIPRFPTEFPATTEFYINLNSQKYTVSSSVRLHHHRYKVFLPAIILSLLFTLRLL